MLDQRTLRTKEWLRPLALLLALLAAGMALPTGAGSEHDREKYFEGGYLLGATPFVPQIGCISLGDRPALCAVAGLIVCEEGILSVSESGVGGSCTPVSVGRGSQVLTTARDAAASTLSWAMCIDGDGNAVCRPEAANLGGSYSGWADTIVLTACAQQQDELGVVNQGAAGNLYLFIMMEPLGGGQCLPTTGRVSALVLDFGLPECSDGLDNDDDGWTDYPLDPECDDFNDDSESPPPPPPPPVAAH